MGRTVRSKRATEPSSPEGSSAPHPQMPITTKDKPMRHPSPSAVHRLLAGGVGVILTAVATFGGAITAEAADTSCVSGVCTVTFTYTGAVETWTVPTGVTSVTASVSGASGGQAAIGDKVWANGTGVAGLGGSVQATLPVQSGEALKVTVGGVGQNGVDPSKGDPAAGGYGGGASAGGKVIPAGYTSGGGGGGSFVFGNGSLLVAAGGGGGAGVANGVVVNGGDGGSTGAGSAGAAVGNRNPSGGGATTSGPGAAGLDNWSGWAGSPFPASGPDAFGYGGAGADNHSELSVSSGGGGGGGGFFGGGGGGTDAAGERAGAGGGGSGFVVSTATDVFAQNGNSGNGTITLSYEDPSFATSLALKVSENPTDGAPTVMSATVSPATATGSVTFLDGTTDLGSATLVNGSVTLSKVLSAGTHTLTAQYSGDSSHGPSSASASVTVAPHSTAPSFGTTSTSDSPIKKSVIAGEPFAFSDLAATGTPSPHYTVKDDDADTSLLPDGVGFAEGVLTGTAHRTGTWQIAVTASNEAGTATEYVRLTVAAGPTAGLIADVSSGATSAVPTATWTVAVDGTVAGTSAASTATVTAAQGSTIRFLTRAVDRFGNTVTDEPVQPATTSSVATDTISYDPATGLTTVLFNHASPHTITFTADGVTNSFTVQVSPASVAPAGSTGTTTETPSTGRLALTGSDPTAPLGGALALLTAGIALGAIAWHRARRSSHRAG